MVTKALDPKHKVSIAVVGKYIGHQDAYKSIYEALAHAGIDNDCRIEIKRMDSEDLEKGSIEKSLQDICGILVPGGFGYRGIEGKIKAIKFARVNKIPFLGLCLGMHFWQIQSLRTAYPGKALKKGSYSL
ncbi:MAG: CTP synthase [candidate division TM6 bacterium GW2011_GWF2_36_6]|nr:MAG: CTP synthase [candidate division TM6 bacterium GW2011_GWF2_36_6]